VDPDVLFRFVSIALINVALSGDNAIVIGMAAASLPRAQRRFAILGGGVLAITLRLVLTSFATRLLRFPLISAGGGLVLFFVAWGLLNVDTDVGGGDNAAPHGLRRAIQLIVVADLTMSLDNVIAVGGTAKGDDGLVLAGLLLSMPLLMAAGGFVSTLIDRYGWLVYLGAGAICLTAARMVLEDEAVAASLPWGPVTTLALGLLAAVAVPLVFRWIQQRRARTVGATERAAPEGPA
jgi:YjbE family integral membrane protein